MGISKRISGTLMPLFGYSVALMVLPFFLLPGTVWAGLSPINEIPLLISGGFTAAHALLISGAILAVWLSYGKYARNGAATWVWLAVLLYLASYAVACFNMPLRVPVVLNCTQVLVAFGAGLLVARLCSSTERAAIVLAAFGTVQAAYAFYNYTHGENVFVSGSVTRASGTLGNPLFLSTMMCVCLPLTLSLAIEEKRAVVMGAWMIGVALLFAALLLAGSRGAILAAAVALSWMVWRVSGRWTTAAAMAVVLSIVCLFVVSRRSSGEVNQASTARSTQGHYTLMQRGLGVFRHHWMTGVGAGSLEVPAPVQRAGIVTETVFLEPKNLIVHWLAELGVGGGALFVVFMVSISHVLRRSSSFIAPGLGAAWIALFVAGLFDTPFGLAARPHANALVGALLGATLLLPIRSAAQEVVESGGEVTAFVEVPVYADSSKSSLASI